MHTRDIVKNLKDLLTCDDEVFEREIRTSARTITRERFGGGVHVCGLLAVGNYCRNLCEYCGLRAPRTSIPRFRLTLNEVKHAVDLVSQSGLSRIFFISGEDIHFSVGDIVSMTAYAKKQKLHVTLGMGLYPYETLERFRDAGTDCYSLKFESANLSHFARCKPGADFKARMEGIHNIKLTGMELGSGNIVGLEHQTIEDLAADITLMNELMIDWAPVVPYIPAPGTPMAETTPLGNINLLLREISILRVLLPDVAITAGQPTQGSKLGFADAVGNRNALDAGGTLLFTDVTPIEVRRNFDITPGRILPDVERIDSLLTTAGLMRM